MIIKSILKADNSLWEYVTLVDSKGKSDLTDFLEGLSGKYLKSWRKLQAQLEGVSREELGPRLLPKKISHEMGSSKYPIFRFSSGDIRIGWFYGNGGKIVLLTHGYYKDSRRTTKSDIETAEKFYESYKAFMS